jgi:hypothetical protein
MSCPAQICSRSHLLHNFSNLVEHRDLPRLRTCVTAEKGALPAEEDDEEEEARSAEYSDIMQKRMGSSLTYRHDDGINFAHVLDDLIVGSCIQTPADVDRQGCIWLENG